MAKGNYFMRAVLPRRRPASEQARWEIFLEAACDARVSDAFSDGTELAVDRTLGGQGVSLDKKSTENVLGARRPSVVQIARDLTFPATTAGLEPTNGLSEFFGRIRLNVDDASPDSVTGVLFFAARQSGVSIPADVWRTWEPAITEWERTGTVGTPETSWPALAAALAHTTLGTGGSGPDLSALDLERAWSRVLPFAVEALRVGYDPQNIPEDAVGPLLAHARAALEEERARYERKLFAQQMHQLSLPMIASERPRLVDALFTTEEEFTGAMKVFARNDRKNAALGRGFTVLVLVRPGLKNIEPKNWVTISIDTRAGGRLVALWYELERLETQAWAVEGRQRPPITPKSRWLSCVPKEDQHFHQQWYLNDDCSLLAAPDRQSDPDDPEAPGSLLTTEQINEAIFRVYDPFVHCRVHSGSGNMPVRIPDVTSAPAGQTRRILSARWSKDDPLPHPASPVERGGLFPTALRAMGARTLGIASDDVVAKAPDLEEIDLVPFGNGLAVVTDEGAFLLDSGRDRPAQIDRAIDLVRAQADLAEKLDRVQLQIECRARNQADELRGRGSTRSWLDHQRFCANLHADLIHLRGVLDKPLETGAAGLQPLKDHLSRRWNIRARIGELAAEVEWLQQNGRAAEELRAFRAGRWAAGIALAVVVADALAGRVAPFVLPYATRVPGLGGASPAVAEIISFCAIFALTLGCLIAGTKGLRTTARSSTT